MLLKSLEGAAFGAKLKEIACRKEFHALPDNPFIYTVGGNQDDDYPSLLMAARKAVEHGYRVCILPNPHGVKTPDYILERRVHKRDGSFCVPFVYFFLAVCELLLIFAPLFE